MSACQITEAHCEQCGNTAPEDIRMRSYSGCCNEIVVSGPSSCSDSHGFDQRCRAVERSQGACTCGATDWLLDEVFPNGIWRLRCQSCYADKTIQIGR